MHRRYTGRDPETGEPVRRTDVAEDGATLAVRQGDVTVVPMEEGPRRSVPKDFEGGFKPSLAGGMNASPTGGGVPDVRGGSPTFWRGLAGDMNADPTWGRIELGISRDARTGAVRPAVRAEQAFSDEAHQRRIAADMTVSGQLRRARKRLSELQLKSSERARRLAEENREEFAGADGLFSTLGKAQASVARLEGDDELRALSHSISQVEEQIKMLEKRKFYDEHPGNGWNWMRRFGHSARQAFADEGVNTLTFGAEDAADAATRLQINRKAARGEQLTEAEEDALADEFETQMVQERVGDLGNAYTWGTIAGVSPWFMAQFLTTGGGFSGLGQRLGTRMALKLAERGARRMALESGESMGMRLAEGGLLNFARKGGRGAFARLAAEQGRLGAASIATTRMLGVGATSLLVRAPLMTGTVQAGQTATKAIDTKLGPVIVDGQDGSLRYEDAKEWGEAVWQAGMDQIIENASEMGIMNPLGLKASDVARLVGTRRLTAMLLRSTREGAGTVLSKTAELMRRGGLQGYMEEAGEEYSGQLWRTMLGLESAYTTDESGRRVNLLATGGFHGDVWAGLALSMGMTSGVTAAAGYGTRGAGALSDAVRRRRMGHRTETASAAASSLFGGETWETMRMAIDATDNADFGRLAEQVAADDGMNGTQKAAVMDYMERVMQMRGDNLRRYVEERDGLPRAAYTADEREAAQAWSDGYEATEPDEMQDIRHEFDFQRKRLAGLMGLSSAEEVDGAVGADVTGFATSGGSGAEFHGAVMDYAVARMAYEGMIRRVQDEIELRISDSDALIRRRTNPETGAVQQATLKANDADGNGRRAYVVGGTAVMLPDGSGIDRQASSGSIAVIDEETGEVEMVAPDAVLRVEEPVDAATLRAENAEAIRQQFAQEAADRIDGVVPFNPGDTYTLTGSEGHPVQVQIVANQDGLVDNGDGTVNVTTDGGRTVAPMLKDDIQAMVDATNRGRVARFEAVRAEENARMEPGEGHAYRLNEEVTVRGSDGSLVRGFVVDPDWNDGTVLVQVDTSAGERVIPYTREELDRIRVESEEDVWEVKDDYLPLQGGINETNNGTVSEPVSQGERGTEAPQDARMEEAAAQLRARIEAADRDAQASGGTLSGGQPQEIEQRTAESYAKEAGLWIPISETFAWHPLPSGNENDVYLNTEDGYVYKVNNLLNSKGIVPLFERIRLHNRTFPSSRYEFVGFTGFDGGSVYPVFRQEYVNEGVPATPEEIEAYMQSLGFARSGEAEYSNGELTISDLRPRNVLKDAEGDLYVIDADFRQETGGASALERIPKDEQGQPLYEQADPDTAWDAIVEQAGGSDAMAQRVADSMVADKEAELKKVEKSKPKGGTTIAEKIAAERERENAVEQAKTNLALWQRIAQTSQRRRQAAMAEQSRQTAEAARLRREQEEQERAAREEAERIRREALNGVPDFVDDTPQDARARGYRRVNGEKVDRQPSIPARQGREVQVKFDDKNIPTGHVALIEANQLQPSHMNGLRNPRHFIDEAQPKERNDDASVMSARRIAAHIRPEEITSSVTAYTGAPTVNTRGEVIQGNNRSAALREMWAGEPEQAAAYKQYLTEHAADFGLTPEDVEAMRQPVLVNMLDVTDEEAISLGQFVASDTESGGTERIKPKNIVQKMGDDMKGFAGRLLASPDEEMTFSELVDRNGMDVLKWMQAKNYITPTQYRSAFDSKGNLTAEAKNDLKGVMFQGIFQNGNTHLEEMFGALPAKAQKGILSTAYRDYDSPNTERLNAEIQNSISAYYALSKNADFVNAKNYKDAAMAVEAWKRQLYFDDVTGESYLPSERYSNFALLLATMYKGQTQKFVQNVLKNIFDLVQGTQEATLFEEPDNTPRTLVEAVNETLNSLSEELLLNGNFIYNGQRRDNVLGSGGAASQQGRQGSDGNAPSGGRTEGERKQTDNSRGTETDSGLSQRDGTPEAGDIRQPAPVDEKARRTSIRLNGEQCDILLSQMREQAEVAHIVELNPTTWNERFGETGIVNTPIGEVKMGENQIAKFFAKGREKEFGMVAPTLSNPDIIIEKKAPAPNVERDTKLLFIKTFIKADGSHYMNFESVTVQKDGMEVSISSHEVDEKVVKKEMQNGNILHLRSGLPFSSEWYLTETPIQEGPDLVPTSDNNEGNTLQTAASKPHGGITSSDNKGTEKSLVTQTIGEKVAQAEAETNQNPTEAQKEAGNYKKGHVRIGQFDITVENPKGSVRRGTDANGNPWETTMQNTYGYIRGTEGVDGDHIDVFLTDDIDGWNGRRVYVVDQYNEDGTFDEHKVMLGFNEEDEARDAYFSNYSKDWADKHKIVMTSTNLEDFEKWIQSSHRKTKPFAEYRSVNKVNEADLSNTPGAGFEITPEQYITKRGKVLDMFLVKFAEPLTKEQQRAAKELAKAERGWYDRDKDGFMMRSEESAKQLIDAITGDEEAVNDAQPLSLADMQHSSEPAMRQVDVEGLMQAINHDGAAKLSDYFVADQAREKKPKNSGQFGLVSDERMEELKRLLKQKIHGQMNSGIPPEVLAWGMELTAGYIDRGIKKFADYAKVMIDDMGDAFRPYLKAFYNGTRDLPEVVETGLADEMTPYDEVRTFDTANFDKSQGDAMATAEMVVAEQEANRQAEEAKRHIAEKRSANKKKAVFSPQMPDLFGSTNETQNEEGNETVQELRQRSVEGRTDRHAGHTPRQMGGSQRHEVEQPAGERVDTGSGTDVRHDGERGGRLADVPEGESRRVAKNRDNNHAERGTDYAPTTSKARYDANVNAIRLAKELTDSGGQATDGQKAVLRQYSGWGGLGSFFNNERTRAELVELLGDDGYQQAAMSINSAYYTPASVVDTMWDIVKNLGFKGGNILEGSAGIGNILGLMPMDISDRSDLEAVEIDGVSGMILKLLYPDAKVDIRGFENTQVRNGSVDLAITNVPFVTGLHVHDTTGDRDLSRRFGNIHDFCIAKNVRKLREGGIGVFISSSGTLDKSKALRDWVVNEGNADFIGAFRLNNKTFGGTTATSDIIVVRKRINGNKSAGAIDLLDTESVRTVNVPVNDNGREKIKPVVLQYNKYFVDHPENMGGEMALNYERGETFRPEGSGLFPTNSINQRERMQKWADTFKDKAVDMPQPQTEASVDTQPSGHNGTKDGTLVAGDDGSIHVVYRGRQEPLGVNDKKVKGHTKAECLEDYDRIKRALNDVLDYETFNEGDSGLKPLLKELNDAYDSFKDKYGNLNKNTAISFLRNDIDFPGIQALEKYSEANDKNGKRVAQTEKTSVFKERVVQKEAEPHPTNMYDAVRASVFKTGLIDIPYIANELGMSHDEVNDAIVKGGYGFVDPATQTMEVNYKYLSGNVREKLAIAEANNEDGRYDKNIKALRKVMPMDIPAHLIEFTFGSSWVNPKLFADYVNEKTGVPVTLTNVGGQWNMELPYFVATEKNKSEGVRSEKLHKLVLGTDLMNAAINNRTITVSTTQKTWDGKTETITDKEATQACAAKIDDIRNDFKDWARMRMQSDPELAKEIERVYNERFNNYVPVQVPNEFVPERFPGASTRIKLFPHQSKAVVRATGQPIMLAHEVGTGKTFTLITTAMEMRRLGLARKPMIVVQNATVGQFVASAKELYPNAKVLTIADNERNEEGRKRFYAKIKYNDWDMIVVPQSVFERIPDSEERQMDFINDRIEEKEHVLEQMQEVDPKSMIARNAKRELDSLQTELAQVSDKKKQKDEKRAAKTRQNAAAKAQEQLDRATDDVENFDDMEIDAVLVDEAHEYKHLGFSTAMQRGVKGVDPSYSKKSAGVYLKTRAVMDRSGGKNVVFATGTPISNTAAEIWTFMRYLMPKHTMEEYGIYYFDDFVRNFGNLTQMLEFTTSGKFKENNRFSGYVNIPELMRIWSGVADTVLTSETDLKDKLPETVESGQKATDIYLPQSASLRSIMKAVRSELERFDKMTGKEKKENSAIPLVMYGIAKAAAIDPRLVMADAVDEPVSKTNRAVEETLKSLETTKGYKGTVAIFCDTYQNKQTGFNIYEEIKRKLVERGVPENQIVVMHSGMSVNKKSEIFDKVNAGDVRVIMGSTFTLGTGVNIQERLNTLIHLDAPNRPMDYTQRNGRILRQGNLHKEWGIPVKILRFGVEDSLDITAYQRLKTKGAIADSVMEGKKFLNDNQQDRTLEEQEDVFGDTVAQLSGSEYALLKNQAERDFRKYNNKKKQYEADQIYVHNAIPRYDGQIRTSEETIKQQQKALSAVEGAFPDGTVGEITIGNSKLSGQKAIGDYIKDIVNRRQAETEDKVRKSPQGTKANSTFTLKAGPFTFTINTEYSKDTEFQNGSLFPVVHRNMTYSCDELGLSGIPVHRASFKNAVDDIVHNVLSGNDMRERIETENNSIERNRSELEQLKSREGKPFENEKELEEARRKVEEYTEKMRKEMEAKEKKYAEMDAQTQSADLSSLSGAEEAEEEGDTLYRETESDITDVNERFNEELQRYQDGEMDKNEMFHLGNPNGVMRMFLPNLPIVMRQRVVNKGSNRKHDVDVTALQDMPERISEPIFVFKKNDSTVGILTEMKDRNGRNVFVAFDVDTTIQDGGKYLEVNNITTVHGRRTANIIRPILENNSLKWVNKEKALDWFSSASPDVQQEITNQELSDATKIVQNFENPSVSDENLRAGNGALTDDDLSTANDPVSKLLGKSTRTAQQRGEFAERERGRMVERVRELAETLHLDNVDIVTDASTLQGNRAKAKGFFSRSTGKITIVIPNQTSVFDVEQTLLHEAVAHYGLRQLFGEHFDTFLDNVFQNAEKGIQERIAQIEERLYQADIEERTKRKGGGVFARAEAVTEANTKRRNGDYRKAATEEYLASLAENTNFENTDASWWQKIKELFLRMLHKIGFENFSGVTLSDNELRYILWRSYENLAEPGRYRSILGEAEDVAKQNELKVGNYVVTDNTTRNVAEGRDELYRDGDPEVHERTLARDRYEQRVKRGVYQMQEALQDSMLGLREAMEAILKGEGKKKVRIEDVDGFENAYLGENRLSSVNKAEADSFAHTLFKPLLDEVGKLVPTKEAREELTDYMRAKHGLERNRMMRQREKDKLIDASELSKDKPQPPTENDDDYDLKMDAYNKALEDWNNQVEAELGDKFEAIDQRDFAGLTALTDTDNVADAEAEARIMVEDYESGHNTDTLWGRTNAVSDGILSKLYESGMMSKETYDNIRSMYDYYIPLRGFDEKTGEEAYAYLNSKNSAFNAPIKTAKGRKSKADDPFAYLQSMAESAIAQGNRNKLVKQRFLNFVLNHPSDLASVSDLWLKYDKVADEWQPVFPEGINADDSPAEVERKMQDFENRMKELAEQEPDLYKHGKDTVNIPYRVVEKRDLRQHQVVVKRGGRDYVITINGNPRAAQALNGQTNPDNDMSGAVGAILKAGERINRELSALYTTRNPDFVVSNFIRDMLYSNSMMWIKESPNYALRFHRNFAKVNPVRMKMLLAKYRKNELDMSIDTERMFHQFMMNGGETGYSNMRDIEKHKNDIRREIRKAGGRLPIRKAWDLLAERLDEVNRGVENCARFAAFMTSREMGRTIDRSIYDAKEISVNFNKKGSGAKFMGATGQTNLGNVSAFMSGTGRSFFVFWNAAIQGTANFGRQAKRHPAKALTGLAVMFLLGAVVASLGYGDDDEDDKNSYWNLPEYVRRSNLLFRAGDQWISIPLPVEYRAVYGLGELMTSTLGGKEHFTDGELANKIAGQVSQLLPLDFMEGGGGFKAFIPSSIKPFAEAYGYKKSWTGLPIYKDTPYNKEMPEWTKAYKSANKYLVDLSETLNEMSGGDKYTKGAVDFNPAQVEYVLNGYFGGIANTIDRMTKMGETFIGQREYDPKSFLVLNRILKNGDERTEYKAVNNEYFRLKEEHDKLRTRLRNYERDTEAGIFDYAEKINFLYNSPEYARYEIFENYRPYIDDLYDMLKEANTYGDKEEAKDIEAQLNELKKMMISDMNKTRK